MSASSRRDAAHIARHDPARVLAECEAKRAVVELHADGEVLDHWEYECTCGFSDHRLSECKGCVWHTYDEGELKRRYSPCRTLSLLALPYADHPDCREEWRP